jgi:hypothetical protein
MDLLINHLAPLLTLRIGERSLHRLLSTTLILLDGDVATRARLRKTEMHKLVQDMITDWQRSSVKDSAEDCFLTLNQCDSAEEAHELVQSPRLPLLLRLANDPSHRSDTRCAASLINLVFFTWGTLEDEGPHPYFQELIGVSIDKTLESLKDNKLRVSVEKRHQCSVSVLYLYKNQNLPESAATVCTAVESLLCAVDQVSGKEALRALTCIVTVRGLWLFSCLAW